VRQGAIAAPGIYWKPAQNAKEKPAGNEPSGTETKGLPEQPGF
jgi:hypothetical protein